MIVFEINKNTTTIFTLSEKEETVNNKYILNMKNTLTGVNYTDIEIFDKSNYIERYNKFLINVTEIYNEFIITENTVLEEDTFYIINSDIVINENVTLEIPSTTYVIQKSDYNVINNGTILNPLQIVSKDIILDDNHYIVDENNNITILLNMNSGYYDYTIFNESKTNVLEIGRMLIKKNNINKTYYNTPDKNVHVYKK